MKLRIGPVGVDDVEHEIPRSRNEISGP